MTDGSLCAHYRGTPFARAITLLGIKDRCRPVGLFLLTPYFDLPVVIVRPFNTYGPRQSARAVIPTIITQIANGQRQIRLGAVSPTRDFNFVSDTVSALIAALESSTGLGEVINFGSNFEISIGDTVKLIAEVMNREIEIDTDETRLRPVNSEVERLWAKQQSKEITELATFLRWPRWLQARIIGNRRVVHEPCQSCWFPDKADRYNI